MTLPASGAISLNNVNVELGLSGTASINMGSAAVRGLFGVASGAISMSDGYGKSSGPNIQAIPAPTNSNTVINYPGAAYLPDTGDGNGDVMFAGGVSGGMRFIQFGTNNKLSTWGSSSPVSLQTLPSQQYNSGDRAFFAQPISGTRKFVVIRENWLGYSAGQGIGVYSTDGSASAPVLVGGWTSYDGDQADVAGLLMDATNPGNGMVVNTYSNSKSPVQALWAYPFRVEANNSITVHTPFQLNPYSAAVPFNGGIYYGGRVVVSSPVSQQNYVCTAQMNANGSLSSVGTPQIPSGNTQSYGWASDTTCQTVFCLNGVWVVVYRDDSANPTQRYMMSRITFSGNTMSFVNTVNTGLNMGNTARMNYKVGTDASTTASQIYLACYGQTTPTEQCWEWTGSAFSKIYEKTGSGLLDSIVGLYGHKNDNRPGPMPVQYTTNDNVIALTSNGGGQRIQPSYWKHK